MILIFIGKLMRTHLALSMFQLREHCMLGDRSAQYEMEIQTILTGILPHVLWQENLPFHEANKM